MKTPLGFFASLSLACSVLACSSSDDPRALGTAGASNIGTAGASNIGTAGASNIGTAGASNIGTAGASNIGTAGASNIGTAGSSGAGTAGSSGAGTAGSSGAGTAGSSGAGTAGSSGAGTGADAEPASMQGMLEAHNAARAAVSPAATPAIPPLSWSSTLSATAQAWADGCQFEHSGGKFGENLYASAGASTKPQDVVSSWVSEVKDYDYAANSCSGVCGHYTQVVWRDSAKVGCGVTNCTKNSPFDGFAAWQIWVCNYDPPGNYVGQKPY